MLSFKRFSLSDCCDGSSGFTVILGSVKFNGDLDSQRIDVPFRNIHLHPEFDRSQIKNDICLLKLSTSAVLSMA